MTSINKSGEPVAWRHSKTLCLYETEEEVPLADGDEWAEPLYTSPQPFQPARAGEAEPAYSWMPIESAPRDGRNILIRFGQDGVSQAKYVPGVPHPWKFIDTNDGVTWLINSAVDGPGGPSHWMRMPHHGQAQPTLTAPSAVVLDDERAAFEKIAVKIHYPACWDTAAFPTLAHALVECAGWYDIRCGECLAGSIARAASPQATAMETPAKLAHAAVRMLNGYAESYDAMARDPQGDGQVQCLSVAQDIRVNMAGWFGAYLAERATAAQPVQTERSLTFAPLYKKLMRGDVDICEAYLRLKVVGSCPTEEEFNTALAMFLANGDANG